MNGISEAGSSVSKFVGGLMAATAWVLVQHQPTGSGQGPPEGSSSGPAARGAGAFMNLQFLVRKAVPPRHTAKCCFPAPCKVAQPPSRCRRPSLHNSGGTYWPTSCPWSDRQQKNQS